MLLVMPAASTADARVFTPARAEQGFRDQAHLDRFYRYYDHGKTCAACAAAPEGAVWLEGSASWQPTVRACAESARLLRAIGVDS